MQGGSIHISGPRRLPSVVWTEEEDATLKRLWAEGYSGSEIGVILHRTRNAIIGRVHRLDLPPRAVATMTPPKSGKRRAAPRPLKPRRVTHFPRVELTVAVVAPVPAMASVMALTARMCRYPIGDPKKPGFGFCGAKKQEGSSYCGFHHRICWTLPDRGRRGVNVSLEGGRNSKARPSFLEAAE